MAIGEQIWATLTNTICARETVWLFITIPGTMSDGFLSPRFQSSLKANFLFPVVWKMIVDLHMHVICESVLKDALLKAELLPNAKYFCGFLFLFKKESLTCNLVHNSRSWSGGKSLKEKRKEKKKNVILN